MDQYISDKKIMKPPIINILCPKANEVFFLTFCDLKCSMPCKLFELVILF